jgi:hypothetical protein
LKKQPETNELVRQTCDEIVKLLQDGNTYFLRDIARQINREYNLTRRCLDTVSFDYPVYSPAHGQFAWLDTDKL